MSLQQPQALSSSQIAFQALQRWVDSRFHCMMGPPAAYFEVPIGEASLNVGLEEGKVERPFARFVYQTLRWGCKPEFGSPFEVTAALCAKMSESFDAALAAFEPDAKPLLFWRRTPELSAHQEDQVFMLRCRLVVPGYSFPDATEEGKPLPMLTPELIARV